MGVFKIKKRAVFLDRDGVINAVTVRGGVPHPPKALRAFRLLSGVPEACKALSKAGYLLIVVTNQPDVARGNQEREICEKMNAKVMKALPVKAVLACYHDDQDKCNCRKPKPGLFLKAASRWRIDLSKSYMVGDRWRDIGAGKNAGCRTILIERHYSNAKKCIPDARAVDLLEASRMILLNGG